MFMSSFQIFTSPSRHLVDTFFSIFFRHNQNISPKALQQPSRMPHLRKRTAFAVRSGPPISFATCLSKAFEGDGVHRTNHRESCLVRAVQAYGWKFGDKEVFNLAQEVWDSGDRRPTCIALLPQFFNAKKVVRSQIRLIPVIQRRLIGRLI
jgi:hypothetical protein